MTQLRCQDPRGKLLPCSCGPWRSQENEGSEFATGNALLLPGVSRASGEVGVCNSLNKVLFFISHTH